MAQELGRPREPRAGRRPGSGGFWGGASREDRLRWLPWKPLGAVLARALPGGYDRHILVPTEEKCLELKTQIAGGASFEDLAKEHSTCPSGKSGGALGEFGPGQMVKEFDTVVFNEAVGEVHGPVKTQFGYHLLEVTSRD